MSPVSEKADFVKPNRSLKCWGEPFWRRGGGKKHEGCWETDICLWDVIPKWTILFLKVQPVLTIKGRDCHHDPLYLSHFRNIHPAGASAKQPVIYSTDPCVSALRWQPLFLPLSPPFLTPPRRGKLLVIGCGWIVGGRRGVLCISFNNVWRRVGSWASSQSGIGCLSGRQMNLELPGSPQWTPLLLILM